MQSRANANDTVCSCFKLLSTKTTKKRVQSRWYGIIVNWTQESTIKPLMTGWFSAKSDMVVEAWSQILFNLVCITNGSQNQGLKKYICSYFFIPWYYFIFIASKMPYLRSHILPLMSRQVLFFTWIYTLNLTLD